MLSRYPIFVKRDLDGFFGLAIDNLVQLLLILALCGGLCGMWGDNESYIYRHILPGVAVSLLIGNVFYALQAHWVARRERRSDVTALPYGINTVSLLVYVFFVMKPTYDRTGDAELAWKMGLVACLGSGIIEFVGAFFAERLRRNTPRAALLSTLAGIAITFISMTFALEIWQRPLVAMVPMAVVLVVYFSQVTFPLGIPGGLVAVLLGTALAWGLGAIGVATGVPMDTQAVQSAWEQHGKYWPIWSGTDLWEFITDSTYRAGIIGMLSVIIPMGLFNVIGSLQNIESAEAGGDVFATGPSLAVNGIGTIAAALFGSCFPTTIYIGHPGWKAMGARAGYSWLNGLVMTAICLTGTVPVIAKVVPMEAGIAIVLWIGIVITAQAFQASPLRHAPAAAMGLFPAIAAWGALIVAEALTQAQLHPVVSTTGATQPAIVAAGAPAPAAPGRQTATPTMQDLLTGRIAGTGENMKLGGFLLHGMNIMERGYIFTCMIMAAIAAFLIDRRFFQAAGWSLGAAVLTLVGLIHAYQLAGNTVDFWLIFTRPAAGSYTYNAYPVAIGYLLMAGVFAGLGLRHRHDLEAAHTVEDARVVSETMEH
ncbi:MAG: NCS2 family permease [Planctomycetes bacterium]|nr:NCS2 family permease [Planctomycetota bacterium]